MRALGFARGLEVATHAARVSNARLRGLQPLDRYFHPAAGALGCEFVVDDAAKLIRDEVADHRRAISSGAGHGNGGTTGLLPLEHDFPIEATVRRYSPAYPNTAVA